MKKGLVVLIWLLFALVIIFPQQVIASDSYDQRCIVGGIAGNDNINRSEENRFSQTFTPTKNRLTRISIYVQGTGTGNFHIDLYHGDTYVASTPSEPEPNGAYYVSQYFSEEVVVTPGDSTYKIIPRVSGDNIELRWYFSQNCYNGGIAYEGANYLNNDPIWDFGFVTFGHDVASPSGSSPIISSGQGQAQTSSTAGGMASVKTIDKNIKAPGNLRYNLKDNAVNLAWDASETPDITGYNIYRSLDNQNFEFITGTNKDTLVFKDTMIEKSQIYYYFVRTQKGESESDISNIIKAEQKEIQALAERGLPLWQKLLYIIGTLLILSGLGYLVYRKMKRR